MKRETIALIMAGFLIMCGACSRLMDRPSAPTADLGISSADDALSVSVNYVIVSNGPGSWMEDASWDEYVLTVSNLTGMPVTVESIKVIDPRGLFIENGDDPDLLEKKSSDLAKKYSEYGISLAASKAASAAGLGSIFGPLSSVFGIGVDHYEQSGKQDIRDAFERRRINSFRLSGNDSIQGSAFFPVIPSPRAIVVNYRNEGNLETVEVPLERLKGLHVSEDEAD